jgi:hypothetical protein
MIKGKKRIELTPEAILQRLSDFDLYRYFMGRREWKINQVTHSPFHVDNTPSFLVGNKNGYLYHVDFSTGQRGGCFDFVMQLYNISLHEALLLIDQQFGLGIMPEHDTGEYKRIKAEYKQPEEMGKRYSVIQVITRKFTNEELKYWSDYYQDIQDLRDNNVYSISKAYLNRKLFPIKDDELRFAYLFEGSYWKLYFPNREKKRKWISNVPLSLAYGLNNLNKDHNTLICKSLKDYLLCKKVYDNVCGIQNESLASISEETAIYINKNSKEVFYGGDSDEPGKQASYIITKAFGWKHINPPDYLLNDCCKDFADWGKLSGVKVVEKHFIEKGLKL